MQEERNFIEIENLNGKNQKVEEKRNRLNLELRSLLSVIDMIDGLQGEYIDYKDNSLNEEQYLDEQLKLVVEAKTRLVDIFKH